MVIQGESALVIPTEPQRASWDYLHENSGAEVTGRRSPGGHALTADDVAVWGHALDAPDPAAAIREVAPQGADRIIEVAFSDNLDLDASVAKAGSVIAAYATRRDRPDLPFWPMLFDNLTTRLLGSDDFPAEVPRPYGTGS